VLVGRMHWMMLRDGLSLEASDRMRSKVRRRSCVSCVARML
jgi:hypothetical protein